VRMRTSDRAYTVGDVAPPDDRVMASMREQTKRVSPPAQRWESALASHRPSLRFSGAGRRYEINGMPWRHPLEALSAGITQEFL